VVYGACIFKARMQRRGLATGRIRGARRQGSCMHGQAWHGAYKARTRCADEACRRARARRAECIYTELYMRGVWGTSLRAHAVNVHGEAQAACMRRLRCMHVHACGTGVCIGARIFEARCDQSSPCVMQGLGACMAADVHSALRARESNTISIGV
jgi:hypothetical protein